MKILFDDVGEHNSFCMALVKGDAEQLRRMYLSAATETLKGKDAGGGDDDAILRRRGILPGVAVL